MTSKDSVLNVRTSNIAEHAHGALSECFSMTQNPRDDRHPQVVDKIWADYLPDMHHEGVAAAALLHDLADRAVTERRSTEPHAVAMYRFLDVETKPNTARLHPKNAAKFLLGYVMPLLGDMPEIEKTAKLYREASQDSRIRSIVTAGPGANVPVSVDDWVQPFTAMCSPASMYSLLENTNVESVVTLGAEALANLRDPAPTDKAVLQDVYAALYFYYPLLEIMGLDSLATALRGEALKIKVERSGRIDLIHDSERRIAQANGALDEMVDLLYGGAIPKFAPGDPDIFNSMGPIEFHGRRAIKDLQWRIKSTGASSYKRLCYEPVYGYNQVEIADEIGLNAITTNWPQAVFELKNILGCVLDSSRFSLSHSPGSRMKASIVCAGGVNEEHTKELLGAFSGNGADKIEVKQDPESVGYAAYKLYLVFDNRLRLEVQFTTEEAHLNNRAGTGSHAMSKSDLEGQNKIEAGVHTSRIRTRVGRVTLGRFGIVNGQSIGRGYELTSRLIDRGARLLPGLI